MNTTSLLSRTALIVGVAAVALTAGCAGPSDDDDYDDEETMADDADSEDEVVASRSDELASCLRISRAYRSRIATIYNACGRTMRAKIVIAFHPDSRCWTLRPRQTETHYWNWGRYEGARAC
jgi:hypothetical protein